MRGVLLILLLLSSFVAADCGEFQGNLNKEFENFELSITASLNVEADTSFNQINEQIDKLIINNGVKIPNVAETYGCENYINLQYMKLLEFYENICTENNLGIIVENVSIDLSDAIKGRCVADISKSLDQSDYDLISNIDSRFLDEYLQAKNEEQVEQINESTPNQKDVLEQEQVESINTTILENQEEVNTESKSTKINENDNTLEGFVLRYFGNFIDALPFESRTNNFYLFMAIIVLLIYWVLRR